MMKMHKQRQARTNQVLNFVAAGNKPARSIAANNQRRSDHSIPLRYDPSSFLAANHRRRPLASKPAPWPGCACAHTTQHNLDLDRVSGTRAGTLRGNGTAAHPAMPRRGAATAPGFTCTTVHGWTNGGRRASRFGRRATMQTETNGSWRRGADGRTAAEQE